MLNIGEAILGAHVARITAETDPNTKLATRIIDDMHNESAERLANSRISTMERLDALLQKELSKNSPNTQLVDVWQGMIANYGKAVVQPPS